MSYESNRILKSWWMSICLNNNKQLNYGEDFWYYVIKFYVMLLAIHRSTLKYIINEKFSGLTKEDKQ